MKEQKTVRVILSAEIAGKGKAYNAEATESMGRILKGLDGISYIPTMGVFEGVQENSFFVKLDSSCDILSTYMILDHIIYDIAFKFYEQQAVLLIETDNTCYMVTPGKKEYIGTWRMKQGIPAENTDCTVFNNSTYGIVL